MSQKPPYACQKDHKEITAHDERNGRVIEKNLHVDCDMFV